MCCSLAARGAATEHTEHAGTQSYGDATGLRSSPAIVNGRSVSASVSLRLCGCLLIDEPILQRLRNMLCGDRRDAREIGDRARDFQHAMKSPCCQVQPRG